MNYLEEITSPTAVVRAFYLRESIGSRIQAALIVFTPEGIVIMGDLVPGWRAAVSAFGKGLEWFSGELSPDYLASKFLEKDFLPESAARYLSEHKAMVAEQCDVGKGRGVTDEIEAIDEAIASLMSGDWGAESFYSFLHEQDIDGVHDGVGRDYHPGHLDLLVRTQKAFARLYREAQQ